MTMGNVHGLGEKIYKCPPATNYNSTVNIWGPFGSLAEKRAAGEADWDKEEGGAL